MPTNPGTSAHSGLEIQPFLKPNGELSSPAGFAAPPSLQSDRQQVDDPLGTDKVDRAALLTTASKVLQDPLLLRKLSDRVYELMLDDLRYQRERSRNYGS